MKIHAINGSPRKKWNTATILENFLQGAEAAGAQTELINLYDLKYKGCISCFQCKLIGGPSYGKCAVKDDLAPVLEKVLHGDGLAMGSPIYFSDVTGMMRCFMERLYFPNFVYDKNYSSLAPKKLHTAFIYTMNVPVPLMETMHYPERLSVMENFAAKLFDHKPQVQYVNDTFQFPDYAKYKCEVFSASEKAAHKEKQFPQDCQHAREMGAAMAEAIRKEAN